jgi:hypothetical protein
MQKLNRFLGATGLALISMVLMAAMPSLASAQSESMLYLVEFEATGAGAPTTPQQAIELLDKLIIPSIESLAKDGKIQAGGILVGARAGVAIVGAKSHDEVTELVRALPAWGVWHWTVTPLESFAHRASLEKKMVQQLRKK